MAYTAGPFDSTHLYLQWGGKLPGAESWSCGVRLAGPAGTAEADAVSMLPAVTAAVSAFHSSINAQISVNCKLSEVKLNAIGTNGRYVGAGTNQQVVADLSGGGTSSPAFPNQIAMAVSLTTGFSRGPAHRGRFYVPMITYPIGSDGRISTTDANAMKTQLTALIAAINAANAGWKVNVFSRKAGAAAHRPVTGNQVGMVLDTQRRRRRSLLETYV